MPVSTPAPNSSKATVTVRKRPLLYALVTAVLLIAIVYFGKPVLMPLSLAVLFAFLLSPVVNLLYRCKIPRALAVVIVTVSVFSLLGVTGWVIGREISSLAASLPNYKDNIRARVTSFYKSNQGGVMDNLKEIKTTIEETTEAAAKANLKDPDGYRDTGAENPADPNQAPPDSSAPSPSAPVESAPTPTEKEPIPPTQAPAAAPAVAAPAAPPGIGGDYSTLLGSAGEILGIAATVIVFVIFMLVRQQELRNRIMRLAGFRHVTIVTRAMDETGERVGRYLLMQALINCSYGAILAIGLYFIGLPYVVLWGVLAALFRFVPYVGPVAVGVLPSLLSLAFFPDWQHPLMVIGLICTLELITNMLVEPVLYGSSVGVSEFALLVAIVFWTWLWGGIGLMMATPLTVCLVVAAKHIPSLEWVDVLMGDNPKLKSYMVLYQRLLAGDEIEAGEFVSRELEEKPAMEVMDDTVLPAIALAKRELKNGRLTEEEEQRLHDSVFRVMGAALPEPVAPDPEAPLILGRALDEGADEAALKCFDQMLAAGINFEVIPALRLSSEFHAEVASREPDAVLISATPPGSHTTGRIQIRRLRQQFPKLKIYIGRWGVPEDVAKVEPLIAAGANAVFTRLSEAETVLTALQREAAAVRDVEARERAVPVEPVLQAPA